MTDAAKMAAGFNAIQWADILQDYPIPAGRPLVPASFYAWDLVTIRRRWWLFGELVNVLTPLGLAVRAHLANPTEGTDHG